MNLLDNMMGVAAPITTGLHRQGYAVLHRCVPAAGIVLVIGIVAYVFIFILGRLEAVADPSATRCVDANSIYARGLSRTFALRAPVTLDTIVARREERACRQEPR
jgi:hypothetical protein